MPASGYEWHEICLNSAFGYLRENAGIDNKINGIRDKGGPDKAKAFAFEGHFRIE